MAKAAKKTKKKTRKIGASKQGGSRGRQGCPPEEYRFKPGQSGNPKGRAKGRSVTTELRRLMDEGFEGKDLAESLAKIACNEAIKGNHKFWKEIIDRLDGKVPDRLADADGQSITIVFRELKVPDGD